MAPRRWINKKKAETYVLVHRSHEDPLYHDPDAPKHVLVKVENSRKKFADDLAPEEFQKDEDFEEENETENETETDEKQDIKKATFNEPRNENQQKPYSTDIEVSEHDKKLGEAALYGINFKDASEYDYMQHLKPIGDDPSAVFVPKKESQNSKNNGIIFKDNKFSLDNKKNKNIKKSTPIVLPSDILPSKTVRNVSYMEQQNIPDSISGFQPDMDPDLREALEALDDDAFVTHDGNDDDFFGELVKDGELEDEDDYEDYEYANYEDGYSDDESTNFSGVPEHMKEHVEVKEDEEEWQARVRLFRESQERSKHRNDYDSDDDFSEEERDMVATLPSINTRTGGKRKARRRKMGTATDLSGYSMSSSILTRSEHLEFLDERFDVLEKKYNDDINKPEEDDRNQELSMENERPDFESIMDEFLAENEIEGKKLIKKSLKNVDLSAKPIRKGQSQNKSEGQKSRRGKKNIVPDITAGVNGLKI